MYENLIEYTDQGVLGVVSFRVTHVSLSEGLGSTHFRRIGKIQKAYTPGPIILTNRRNNQIIKDSF